MHAILHRHVNSETGRIKYCASKLKKLYDPVNVLLQLILALIAVHVPLSTKQTDIWLPGW